ncbi:hypothetical protein ACROYT_G001720 [Oculina patagonica]
MWDKRRLQLIMKSSVLLAAVILSIILTATTQVDGKAYALHGSLSTGKMINRSKRIFRLQERKGALEKKIAALQHHQKEAQAKRNRGKFVRSEIVPATTAPPLNIES